MEKGDYKINNVYEPGHSSFHPSKDIPTVNYRIPSGKLGMTTDPRTANQLQALSTALNAGVVPIEIGPISPQTFDQIPQQHFTEMKRKAKLAESKVSLHAPIQGMDPSGFTQQGWDESNRLQVERQLMTAMDKAYLLDDKENVPVTIHGSNTAGSNWTFIKDPETGERKKVHEMMIAVDRETGQLAPVKREEKYYATSWKKEGKELLEPENEIDTLNNTKWTNSLSELIHFKDQADRIIYENQKQIEHLLGGLKEGKINPSALTPTQQRAYENMINAQTYLEDTRLKISGLYDKAYKFTEKEEERKKLRKAAEDFRINLGILDPNKKHSEEELKKAASRRYDLQNQSFAIQKILGTLQEVSPNLYQSIEDFSVDKASETFSNVALHSYNKYKDKAPVVSIENLYPEMGFSQAKDLKNLIVKSRERFVEKAVANGMSKSQAKSAAEKVIGATFDVGHLNINKKFGFTDEDIAKEAKEISKFVKHVHLTDNFGYSDSHLPLGMGNVPVKEIMKELGEAGSKARKINEVGGWFEHFKTNPFGNILEAAGSPIYSAAEGPYWSHRTGYQQGYNEGYGMMLPQTHYEQFGAGFSRLPSNLGGSVQGSGGAGGRMGGGRE